MNVWALGALALLISAVCLAMFWTLIPTKAWLKGGVLGVTLDLLLVCGVSIPYTPQILLDILGLPIGLWIASVWMGVVVQGIKIP